MIEVISKEQAEEELRAFCEELELDLEGSIQEDEADNERLRSSGWTDPESGLPAPDEGKGDMCKLKDELLRLMQRGRIVIDGDKLSLHLAAPSGACKEFKFEEPDGSAIGSIKRRKGSSSAGDLYPLISNMTKKTPAQINALKKRDLMPCFVIARLFLTRNA